MSILSTAQAIEIAIKAINEREDLPCQTKKEAVSRLERLLERDWYREWDKDSIIEALMKYKEETGKAPTASSLTERGMPKSCTIKSIFHISASAFLKELFPENKKEEAISKSYHKLYDFASEDECISCFREQFNKHICEDMSSKKYDMLRDRGTPSWGTIARYCGITSWVELMKRADVKYLEPKTVTCHNLYVRSATSPYLEKLEAITQKYHEDSLRLIEFLTNKR